jgi:hypothetical protein
VILTFTLPLIIKPKSDSSKDIETVKKQKISLVSNALLEKNKKVEEATRAWLNMPNRRRDVIDAGMKLIANLPDHLYMKYKNNLLSEISQGSMIYILKTHLDSLAQYAGIESQAGLEDEVDDSNMKKVSATREYLIEVVNRLVTEPDKVSITVTNYTKDAMIDQSGNVVDPGKTQVFLREDRSIGDHYEGAFKIDGHSFPYNPEESSIRIPAGYNWEKTGSNKYQLRNNKDYGHGNS